jgi:excinuclease ABC subunit C
VEEADVFAIHQEAGYNCIEVFFFRSGQNWGNRAYFPKADRMLPAGEVLGAFLAQFYDDKPCPRSILLSEDIPDRALLAAAFSAKSGRKIEVAVPQRGERRELVQHALMNARQALERKLAETASQRSLLKALAERFGLPQPPRRIEVFDNSHIQGTNAVGAMIVAGPDGFVKNQYRKFNIRSDISPGDDYAMMRETLQRRFKRLLGVARQPAQHAAENESSAVAPWPDLVLIDGGIGQLNAARETLQALGLAELPVIAVAKGPERDAGNETFFMTGRAPIKLAPRDPVLGFVQRLRDEAHRFAVGAHRTRRKKGIREAGLQEIPGIGPSRKRALLHHFGTLREIERASAADLARVPGISAEMARKIYDFFHAQS